MNSNSQEMIRWLKCEHKILHIRDGLDLKCVPNKDASDKYVQYYPLYGGYVHFEISRSYQQLYVCFHDEREGCANGKDALRVRVKCIVNRHRKILRYNGIRETQHVVVIDSRSDDNEKVLGQLEDVMGDMYDLFSPAFNGIEAIVDKAHDDFVVPDVAISRECMISFLEKSGYLEVNGKQLQPLKDWDGNTGAIYYDSRLNDEVYYKLCRVRDALILELHYDRRLDEPDALVGNLYKAAREKGFEVGSLFSSSHIVYSAPVSCLRPFTSIKQDVEKTFGEMKKAFDPILEQVEKNGIECLPGYLSYVEEMSDLAVPENPTGAIRLRELNKTTFSWVSTVEELFDKRVIKLNDESHTCVVSGQYVIPDYQRPYAWVAENVRTLCRDLLRAARDKARNGYHLGTIILHVDKSKEEFYVVDGQQRLRTISMMLLKRFFYEGPSAKPYFSQFYAKDQKMIRDVFHEYEGEEPGLIIEMLKKSTLVCIAVSDITESFQLFSTQNGRGKELSPGNLLKAYHFHELEHSEGKPEAKEQIDNLNYLDDRWERANIAETKLDGRLLSEVLGEHLYRIRCWSRGQFSQEPFSTKVIESFKGVTIDSKGTENVPLQNLSLLRKMVEENKELIKGLLIQCRSLNDGMGSFVTIDQPIVNGRDFFNYIDTYVNAYRRLFEHETGASDGLDEFRRLYAKYSCGYDGCGRRGDQYARHIFQSLCMVCYDRFGAQGLVKCWKELYRCAYFERVTKSRCYYSTCGQRFAIEAIRVMFASSDLSRLIEGFHELGRQACDECIKINAQNLPDGVVRRVLPVYDHNYS